ncbi:branched-chain amino acid aminotransferase [Streptomyces alkaliterrae]|uniref:Branched-chain-amino-acid aminotransferase n=1 Tax=Streptomyces alkaliterrae TaxID=2213162 RepID=A0A5P0YS77_9ACTN|nr:branched-chain amino acid aminotransferase [Streptomyces alkaliterrae]MBB1255314.1 branched-chain amino acid aminotransferase [Streptomyces alkaliterrae]MBB1261614.1 branched-chain amino acid aminotransferase [Streptomyces alkaliterrae]MQS03145.1 branched-chain amino acid aminotransferase [Streptomyces alkaliterrae]
MTTPRIEFDLTPSANPLPAAEREAVLANPGFGRRFTDHMVTIRWTEAKGWHDAQLTPYAPLEIDPANMTLHYAQSIFEGLKAYRQPDGSVAVFRPDANARRFQRSARRLAMPELPVETFVEACDLLVNQDKEWVPGVGEESLYLRPFMFAAEVGLGVRPANEYLFMVIASPAGPYFPGGVKPLSVWLSEEYVRAAPGGTGEAKCAGNYAASLMAQAQAAAHGCDQVVWLDAIEHRWVEEMGGMNLYFVYGSGADAKVVTPELTGTLLPGITRESLLSIASDLGYRTGEVRISTEEWREGNADGSITEVFACGTAAVITPVGSVKSNGANWTVGDGQPGEITMRLREKMLAIQSGQAEDVHGWMHRLG